MRVVVSALGTDLYSPVDEKFGRAMHFIVYDTGSKTHEVIDNARNRNALQGAGIGAAETVSNAGAAAVITGHLGPKALGLLASLGIQGYVGSGMTVAEALEAFERGDLERIVDASQAQHEQESVWTQKRKGA